MTSETSTKWVYDFSEGNKDLKDLLGGKGANLAEMTNLGLPGPARLHHHHRGLPALPRARRRRPPSCDAEVSEHLAALEKAMGKTLGEPDDPLLVSVRSGREVLDARDDGDRPQHRPQRRVGAGPGRAGRQRAVRLGLLPPADPDVRQDRARHRRRAVRARPRRGQARAGHRHRPRPRRRATSRTSSSRFKAHRPRADRPRLPAGPARADGPRRPRRLRLLEHRPGDHLPPPGAHPQRPRHRRQRLLDGVRQPRRRLRHRRRLHPRPGQRRARASTATTCRTRRARTSSPASATPCRWPTWRRSTRPPTTSCMDDHVDAGDALPGPVRHRVHHRARQAVDAADPRRQAHGGRGVRASPRSWSTRASSTWTRPSGGSPATSSRS